ncbi:hypothetical protein Tco_1193529, partial [Tanacetum coccineum]
MTKTSGTPSQRIPQGKKPHQYEAGSKQPAPVISPFSEIPYAAETIANTGGASLGTIFTTPEQTTTMVTSTTTGPPPAPHRVSRVETEIIPDTLAGVVPDLSPSDFVSQNYGVLSALMTEETRKRSGQTLQGRLNFDCTHEVSPTHQQAGRHKRRRSKDDQTRRHPVIGSRRGEGGSSSDSDEQRQRGRNQNRPNRLRRSPSGSSPSSNSDCDRRKRRRRTHSSDDSSDTGDNNKRRRMPANIKTYDGTGDPDDHLKIFEAAATIENWPQPIWCH